MRYVLVLLLIACTFPAAAELKAGVATVSITPTEEKIPTQLGGYGAREARPAEGVVDTLKGKALIFEFNGQKSALIAVDTCSVPIGVLQDTLQKAAVPGLTAENTMVMASHTHTGLEGFALDRRNVANNKNIGLFSEPMLNFVTDRLAKALKDAQAALQPVKAGAGAVPLKGMNHNRRKGGTCVDDQMTMLRLDKADGTPYAVFVNFTAHGTFVDEEDMLVSAEWAGNMERTVEAMMPGVTCLYANGAEGDQAPTGRPNASLAKSRYEEAMDYGLRVGLAAGKLAADIRTDEVKQFAVQSKWVVLPPRTPSPDFQKVAGQEYKVSQEELVMMVQVLFPEKAPIYALRVSDFELATFPGEPICAIGTAVKDALHQAGIKYPCVASLTSEHIGYILTTEEYQKSGYEATASFYGDGLGPFMQNEVTTLATGVAKLK
jgi:neutral ceramidase